MIARHLGRRHDGIDGVQMAEGPIPRSNPSCTCPYIVRGTTDTTKITIDSRRGFGYAVFYENTNTRVRVYCELAVSVWPVRLPGAIAKGPNIVLIFYTGQYYNVKSQISKRHGKTNRLLPHRFV